MKKRSVNIAGHASSITLEDEFWDTLKTLATAQQKSVNQLITEIDATKSGNLSSALRVYVLRSLRQNPIDQ
jgi:predicted DNA-binding ribbon-helix-helix protein